MSAFERDISVHDGAVLFYTPEAGMVSHIYAQSVLAAALAESGHKVAVTRCFTLFPRCPVMDMNRVPNSAPPSVTYQSCIDCGSRSLELNATFGLPVLDLRSVYNAEFAERAHLAIAKHGDGTLGVEFDGVAFGELCMMDLALTQKVFDVRNAGPEAIEAHRKLIAAAIVSYQMVDEICSRVKLRAFVYHNDYSMLLAGRLAAEKHGVPSYGTGFVGHMNVDRRRLSIRSDIVSVMWQKSYDAWRGWRELALSDADVHEVANDVLWRFKGVGSHLFSPAKSMAIDDLLGRLGLSRDRHTLVAFTSSLDEMTSTRKTARGAGRSIPEPPQPFTDQIDWLSQLCDVVAASPDLQLVVRIHPREGALGTVKVPSQHLLLLRERFKSLPGHCVFVWPEDQLSSYDLAEIGDLGLTSWSTIGTELARLGIPTLTSTNGMAAFPKDDFSEWAPTPDSYFSLLRQMIGRAPSIDTILHAFRWYSLHHLQCGLFLGSAAQVEETVCRPQLAAELKQRIERILIDGTEILELNHEDLVAAQTPGGAAIELAAIRRELRRILHFVFTGEEIDSDYELIISSSAAEPPSANVHTVAIAGNEVTYSAGGAALTRYSPMCARIALLCSSA